MIEAFAMERGVGGEFNVNHVCQDIEKSVPENHLLKDNGVHKLGRLV